MTVAVASRLATFIVALSVTAPWTAHADAPNACKFLTVATVSAALGKPVTAGGTQSVVDHPGASTSSCSYMAGTTIVLISVNELGTAAAALKEYNTQLDNSRVREKDKEGAPDAQKTVMLSGIGEGAFSDNMADSSEMDITAVHGSRVFLIGVVGAKSFPQERLRGLMQTAISH
jgi:hypothetical protein